MNTPSRSQKRFLSVCRSQLLALRFGYSLFPKNNLFRWRLPRWELHSIAFFFLDRVPLIEIGSRLRLYPRYNPAFPEPQVPSIPK